VGFYAFGRVFSGTVRTSQQVRIQGPNYIVGKKNDLFIRQIQRLYFIKGCELAFIEDVPCGNLVCLIGIDQFLQKCGTLTTSKIAHNIKSIKFNSLPIVRCAVEPENPTNLPKLIRGLKRLSKSDPHVQCYTEESGEYIVTGFDELHLKKSLKDLEEEHCGFELKTSKPIVSLRETIKTESKFVCMSKSPNKHNRIFCKAEPFPDGLANAIETGQITSRDDPKDLANSLSQEYDWDPNDSRKIWCFGPESTGANLLVDQTNSAQFLNEIKNSCVYAFQWATNQGVLAEEDMRGIRFNIVDVTLHSDAIHRGGGQIIPTMRRVCYAACLTAKPRLMEPVYLVDIQCPEHAKRGIVEVLDSRRGFVFSEEQRAGTLLYNIKAYLPALESFGFTADLRLHTFGHAFSQCVFDHWQILKGDPTDPLQMAYQICMERRKLKGLKQVIPDLNDYLDDF
jgi:elongation factor 2